MAKMQTLTLSQPKTPEPIVTKFEWRNYVKNIYHPNKFGLNPLRGFCSPYHGLCGSNKLLYKQRAKSMGKPKIRPPLLPHFSTDLFETQNQERYPEYDPTCKICLMWDNGKGVCENGEF